MEAPPRTLEALVRDELRGPVYKLVDQLVRELVAERLNGHAARTIPRPDVAAPDATNGAAPTSHTDGKRAVAAAGRSRSPTTNAAAEHAERADASSADAATRPPRPPGR